MNKILYIFIIVCIASNLSNLRNDLRALIKLSTPCDEDVANLPYHALEINRIMNKLINSDPILLLKRMLKITSLEQMLVFWYKYDSRIVFSFFDDGEPITILKSRNHMFDQVLSDFKYYVLEKFTLLRDDSPERREKFYKVAMKLYHIWFKKFKGHEIILRSLPLQCQMLIGIDPKSFIIREFSIIKKHLFDPEATEDFFNYRCHLENFYMLVRYFTSRHDDLHGLLWVVEQPPLFNLLYLLFHKNRSILNNLSGKESLGSFFQYLNNSKILIFMSLRELIPNFEFVLRENDLTLRFYSTSEYFDPIIRDNELLEDLVIRITEKIKQFS
jgi:hypothetical protein